MRRSYCSGKPGSEYYHVFQNVKVQYLSTGEMGVLFFYPADHPTPTAKRILKVMLSFEVRKYVSDVRNWSTTCFFTLNEYDASESSSRVIS